MQGEENKERNIPRGLLFDSSDCWLKITEETVVGLTDYGQSNIGDIIYLDFVPAGTAVRRGDRCGSIESGKWVGSLLAPISGIIVETNSEAKADPHKVNTDPFGEGWLYRMEPVDRKEITHLMNLDAYKAWIQERINLKEKDTVTL